MSNVPEEKAGPQTEYELAFWERIYGDRFCRYRDLMNNIADAIEKATVDANEALRGLRKGTPWRPTER